tara:strand:- start:208 stop:411 length:204 start_codon:yes stop_codon:yes gene_type:complete
MPKYKMNINEEPNKIARRIKSGLGKIFVSSLNKIACDKNHDKGNMPNAINLIPILNILEFLISNPYL